MTTPFDRVVLNDCDRFHRAKDVIDRVPSLQAIGAHAKQLDECFITIGDVSFVTYSINLSNSFSK